MAFIPIPGGIKIEIKCRKNGAPVINVEWVWTDVNINQVLLEDLGAAVKAWWIANIKPLTHPAQALEEVIVTDWSAENSIQHVEILSTPSVGTATGEDLPSNVAAVVTFYTGFIGRSNRGRVYNCGLTGSQIAGNTLTTTYVAAMITAWAAFAPAVAAVGCEHHVASFRTNNAPRVVGVSKQIVDYGMNNVVDTQRRRVPQVDN